MTNVDSNTTERTIHSGRHLAFKQRGHWEYCERVGSHGVVVILALTPDGKVLLVEQFRPPIQRNVIEMPAGLAGDIAGQSDESLEQAAARELEEETGYRARSIRLLTTGPASSGLSSEMVSFMLAEGLERIGPGGGTDSEEITVHEVPLAEAGPWLIERERAGVPADPKVYGGLWWLERTLGRSVP
ncbi:MAG: NUDIX hydrolase [Chromatiales bacterium]|nr:NUDIX hydrolase [Chromatiales bacterium]